MRTNLSLANSFRTLRAYLAEITRQIGVGLGAAIRHAVVGLNMLMKYVLKASQAFATFMQKIFGKYEGGASFVDMDMSGMSDDMGDFADGADNAADGLDDAADSAEKLKKDLSVLPFDELNQLNKDQDKTSSSKGNGTGSGGGIGGLGDVGDFDDGMFAQAVDNAERELTDFEKFLKDWHDKCAASLNAKDWEGLGSNIAWGLNQGIDTLYDALDPEKAAEKINPWLDAFSTTVNSLTDNLEWEKMGGAIGRGITILVNAANRLLDPETGIDFEGIGNGLGNGFMGAVRNINWTGVGNLISNKFMVGWRIFKGFVDRLDATDIGNAIRDAIGGAVDKLDTETIGSSLGTFITKCATIIKTGFGKKETWVELGTKIGNGINAFLRDFDGKEVAEAANSIIDALKTAIGTALKTTDKTMLLTDIKDFITTLDWSGIAILVAPLIIAKMIPSIAGAIVSNMALKSTLTAAIAKALAGSTAAAGASAEVTAGATTATTALGGTLATGATGIGATLLPIAQGIGLSFIPFLLGKQHRERDFKMFEQEVGSTFGNVETTVSDTSDRIVTKSTETSTAINSANQKWVDDLVLIYLPQYVAANGTAGGSLEQLRTAVVNGDTEMIAKVEEWARENSNYTGQIVTDNQNVATQVGLATDSIKGSNSDAETSIGNLAGKYKGLGDEAAKDLSSVTANAEKLAQKHKTNLEDNAAKSVSALQNATETGAVKSTDAWEKLSRDGTQAVENMYTAISNKLEDLVDLFNDAGKKAADRFTSKINISTIISKAFSRSNLRDAYSTAYDAGVGIGEQIAKGIQSVDIPTPEIYVASYSTETLDTGEYVYTYSIPNYKVGWYARGGLFTEKSIVGLAEAGAEAALPLENKRAMSMVADAIIQNSDGGFGMDENAMANAVARGYALAQMMNQGNERPIQVNATLYTEDNEVLARAVTRGQESIDYRNNATPKLSY